MAGRLRLSPNDRVTVFALSKFKEIVMPSSIFPFPALRAAFIVIAMLSVAGTSLAQSKAPATKSPVPSGWVGTWALISKDFPEGIKPELPYAELDKYISTKLQPWAAAKQQATEWDIDDTGQVCKPDGIFRQGHAGIAGFRFIEAGAEKLYQIWAMNVEERGLQRIYFNSPHPKNTLPMWNGDSRGHWEDDTLVVDTIGFNDKSWLLSDRHPHTEELHVIERYRLFGQGQYMFLRVIVDDRKALTSPYTFTRYYRKAPDAAEALSGPCNQNLPEEDLWRMRRDELLGERQAILDAFASKYVNEPLPRISLPSARVPSNALSTEVTAAVAKLPTLLGIYEIVPPGKVLAGGLKASGTLNDLPLQPAAAAVAKARNLKYDPGKNCQAIGPFRVMARDGTRIELLSASSSMVMMFENTALARQLE